MPVYGSGGSSGPYGAGGGGYGFSPGSYGYGAGQGPSHLPGGVGGGGGKPWDYSMTILAVVVVAILIAAGITAIIWLQEGPDHEKVNEVEASNFRGATISCEAKPASSQAADWRNCTNYGWDATSPLVVSVTLRGSSDVDWADCAGFFANADGSKEEKAGQPAFGPDGMVFARTVGPDDLIAGDAQLKIRCSMGYHFSDPSVLAAKFKFAVGRA